MGRHADPTARRRRLAPKILIAAATVAVLLAGGLAWWATGSSGDCTQRQKVTVTVAPELGDVTRHLLAAPRPLGDGACAVAQVSELEPLQTIAQLGALDASALPRIWVPDSSLWTLRAPQTTLTSAGSMASSPVVLATSLKAVDALGWKGKPPSWGAALTANHALAVPDLAGSAEGLSALAAVRASLGGGPQADNAVVQAVLAAARANGPAPGDALAADAKGGADAPLVPVSEQKVYATDHGTSSPQLTTVYPSDGSPSLDYPVLRVGTPPRAEKAAIDAVVKVLRSPAAQTAVREAGFRTSDGVAPPGGATAGIQEQAPKALTLDPKDVAGLFTRLSSLAAPSRLLAVFDVSTSMRSPVGTGTRVTLARDAAKGALTLFPGNSAIGLWIFARGMPSGHDWTELMPIRTLDTVTNGAKQRDAIRAQLDTLPNRLFPGGTGLYDTTLAAVRAARADYDPNAVSSVVIITDGKDEDEGSIGLPALVAKLRAEVDPTRPVKVIGIALGPDADLDALKQIAGATGGAAYSAVNPADLQTVLFDALRRRG
ncbi:MAG: substrate-binding domain-containing protein [Blastococcus sp.]